MTETRRNRIQTTQAFIRDALEQIAAARQAGATTADDIAEALNRSGFTTWHGQQWDAGTVLELLSSPDAERARLAARPGG